MRIKTNLDRDFFAGYARSQTSDHLTDLRRLASDRSSWGQPLSYWGLLSDPLVQSRIVRLIVQSAIKRQRHAETAIRKAIEEWRITEPHQQRRLMARRIA
jgi:hypothetical protein